MSLSSFDSVPPVYLIFIISMAWIYLLPQAFTVPSWGWWVSFPIVRGLPSSSSQISLLVFWYPPTLFELDFNSYCSFEKFNSWSRDLCRAQLGFGLNFGLPSPTSCAVSFALTPRAPFSSLPLGRDIFLFPFWGKNQTGSFNFGLDRVSPVRFLHGVLTFLTHMVDYVIECFSHMPRSNILAVCPACAFRRRVPPVFLSGF